MMGRMPQRHKPGFGIRRGYFLGKTIDWPIRAGRPATRTLVIRLQSEQDDARPDPGSHPARTEIERNGFGPSLILSIGRVAHQKLSETFCRVFSMGGPSLLCADHSATPA
jgi:hypothetical protein